MVGSELKHELIGCDFMWIMIKHIAAIKKLNSCISCSYFLDLIALAVNAELL